MIAESTCSAILRADPVGISQGNALLCYQELTRVAMEYCTTARQAVQLMGRLAEEHGFYGNIGSALTGSGETLAVIDKEESYVMHILPDDTGKSAIWVAQKVPEGQVACIANMFVIRNVDLNDLNTKDSTFMMSSSAVTIATKMRLYCSDDSDKLFDFAKIYSAGEARHQYYSGRRQWRALSLFAPSLQLSPWYDDLLLEKGYPFSVHVEQEKLSRTDFFSVLRDTYGGTMFDLSQQPASGPFGTTDRYDGANGCTARNGLEAEDGSFERPIGVYRMAYSFVGEPNGIKLQKQFHHLLHFAPHVSQTSVYLPVLVPTSPLGGAESPVPSCLSVGSVKQLDRSTGYWTFRIVKHTARGLIWNRCLEFIQARQKLWEEKIAQRIEQAGENGQREVQEAFEKLGKDIISDWWKLNDEMLLHFGDGWEHDWSTNLCRPIAYPIGWLKHHNFLRSTVDESLPRPPPAAKLWTLDEKLQARNEGDERCRCVESAKISHESSTDLNS